jgi:hypothetical protein
VAKKSIKIAATCTLKTANLKFFYLFPYKHLQIYCPRKTQYFRTKRAGSFYFREGVCFMKLRTTNNKLLAMNNELLTTNSIQSKLNNFTKQSQFFKKSSVYNPNFNNELQQKNNIGHLVKTNPILPASAGKIALSEVEGPIKTNIHLRRIQRIVG